MAFPELFLTIIWSNARPYRHKIIDEVQHRFHMLDVFDLAWSETNFSINMSRFYGEKLPKGSHKEEHVGRGPFTVIVFSDGKPDYTIRQSHRGMVRVNANVFDMKMRYRVLTGGGHMIHATDTLQETRHDLALLLGIDVDNFYRRMMSEGTDRNEDKLISMDLQGADGWQSLEHLFFILNQTEEYVVLRNFEDLPNMLPGHDDIDLLVRRLDNVVWTTNATPAFPAEMHRVHYHVPVSGQSVPFDFRYVGDNYMSNAFCDEILESKIYDARGFYRPSHEMYFYSLLYHALVHKPSIAEDYKAKLVHVAQKANISGFSADVFLSPERPRNILDGFMDARGYKYTRPEPSVHLNKDFAANVAG
jgi:hypothetical protein